MIMAEGESSLTVESSTEATVKSQVKPQQQTRYSARVVIAVNRTGRKNKKCHEMYPLLPDSAVEAAKDLKVFFESLKMYVYYRENVDKTAINELVSEIIKQSHDCGNHEKILFYYIGHGEKGELLPHCTCLECRLPGIEYDRESDGQTQKIDLLIRRFHNDTTKHLRKIPMLFFFDCCQGDQRNEGMMVSMGPDAGVQAEEITKYVNRIPDAGNILVAHSTLPMLKANCHKVLGPIWTRVLLKNLKIDQSISDALHATQREVSKIVCGTNEIPVVQPSMFYSTLYCEPINFYAMMSSDFLRQADSKTAVSSTRDSDSALPDDFYSETIEGDDVSSGSELPETSKSTDSQSESSPVQESDTDPSKSATVYPGLIKNVQRLKDLQEDIEKKKIIISQLKKEITQLKQEAKEKEEEYELELANKEKEINDHRVDLEARLKKKEEELKMTRTKAQASELDNQREKEELRKERDQLKKEHEEAIKRLEAHNLAEKYKLKYEHSEETKALEIKIRDQANELERKKREVAQEREEVAKLKEQISKKEADEARRERDAALKKADEAEKKLGTTQQQIPSTSSTRADEAEKKAKKIDEAETKVYEVQQQIPSSSSTLAASASASSEAVPSSITQRMENMNLKEAGGPDDDDESIN